MKAPTPRLPRTIVAPVRSQQTPPAVRLWLDMMAAGGATEATLTTRLTTLRSLMIHAKVNDPAQLTNLDVAAWLGQAGTQWTRHTYYAGVRMWQLHLDTMNVEHVDLLRGIGKPKTPAPRARPLPPDVIRALLEHEFSFRTHAYIRMALFAALRVHEIAKINADDLYGTSHIRVKGKGGSVGVIPLHHEIQAFLPYMPAKGWWFGSKTSSSGHVGGSTVSATIGRALNTVGSAGTAHMLRDTAATMMQEQVGDIRVTQAFLRHASISSTQKYTAVSDRRLQVAAEALNWTIPEAS